MRELQRKIINELYVIPFINPKDEINFRVNKLMNYLKQSGLKKLVLGISGGQDSTLAGKLCQMAIDRLNEELFERIDYNENDEQYQFIMVRLPYGIQRDENDAQDAIRWIQPNTLSKSTKIITVNIKPAVDESVKAFEKVTGEKMTDFIKGNNKARERMKVQYDIAGQFKGLVIGTDHAAEAITGYFTKYGDGGTDFNPLTGLTKRQGKQLLQYLNCPKHLYEKVQTADLLDNNPGQPDDAELGFTYEDIDNYLEGKDVPDDICDKIENQYLKTKHKRQLPINPYII